MTTKYSAIDRALLYLNHTAIPKLFLKEYPTLKIEKVETAYEVNGITRYNKSTNKYSINIYANENTTVDEILAIFCHECGHIKIDKSQTHRGDHIHIDRSNEQRYIEKEINAWIVGLDAARRLGVSKAYLLFARSIITDKDLANSSEYVRYKWSLIANKML